MAPKTKSKPAKAKPAAKAKAAAKAKPAAKAAAKPAAKAAAKAPVEAKITKQSITTLLKGGEKLPIAAGTDVVVNELARAFVKVIAVEEGKKILTEEMVRSSIVNSRYEKVLGVAPVCSIPMATATKLVKANLKDVAISKDAKATLVKVVAAYVTLLGSNTRKIQTVSGKRTMTGDLIRVVDQVTF